MEVYKLIRENFITLDADVMRHAQCELSSWLQIFFPSRSYEIRFNAL